ncbi:MULTISPECIES: hypothetical protein [unclassified Streptomyces]|uniref:hypothetical protein n=1 Tax=unclassified Streptomyces TaxID=2593676 RepID=UPI003D8A494A
MPSRYVRHHSAECSLASGAASASHLISLNVIALFFVGAFNSLFAVGWLHSSASAISREVGPPASVCNRRTHTR